MVLALFVGAVFAFGVVLLVHVYFLYPAILYVGALLSNEVGVNVDEELPSVALVIAAYNEEEVIAEKIENSLRLNYPRDKLNIIVFSDASSDNTDEIVQSYADAGVNLIRIEGRVGKTECQNRVVKQVNAEIVVFSDADSMYEPDAIRQLLTKFDDDVGCVVGELRYKKYGVEAESVYRRYEKLIKRLEPRLSSLVGGNGAIYAVRRASYVPLPPDHISDFSEPLAIVENGERVEYAQEAAAWENTNDSVESEASRRVRISTRSWNTIVDYFSLLNPFEYPLFSFQLASHHVLRWLSPILLGLVAVTNVLLVILTDNWLYQLLLGLQTAFYAVAGFGALTDRLDISVPNVFHVPYYFLRLNLSLLKGFYLFVNGRNMVTWSTKTRTTD